MDKLIAIDRAFRLLLVPSKKFLLLFKEFCNFFFFYLKKKVVTSSTFFEKNKNFLVKFFMMKRGRYNRPFLHITAMVVLAIGVLIAPFIAETFPVFSQTSSLSNLNVSTEKQSIIVGEDVFQTKESDKPRDKVLDYIVEKGDTLSTIAKKFGISVETIKWVNNLSSDDLTIGDELKILPVTGIWHKVSKGETVYTIAKKLNTNPQQIVDFPFNDFANPETFSLVEGQMLIVPDGIKPSEQPATIRRQTYIVQGPVSISSAGFSWPVQGIITQFSSWYHTALDIASPVGTPIVAARGGRVIKASSGTWDMGFGNNVVIDHGDGFQTLYAHLSTINVGVGDAIGGGKNVIGYIGMTGRTTGPHLHFEIRKEGSHINPLPFLQ